MTTPPILLSRGTVRERATFTLSTTQQKLFGVFLFLHGLAHAGLGMWAGETGRWWLPMSLWELAMVGFLAAGFGAVGVAGLRNFWRPLTVISAVASLLLLIMTPGVVLVLAPLLGVEGLAIGVVLSLAKLKRILAIDALARTATVQPGVRNLAISEAAAAYGLFYAPDPSSQIACSIGGNVAENSGGVHCLKYGMTTNNVLGCEIVLITGEIIRIGGKSAETSGYDLMGIITGSEGLLGVLTEVIENGVDGVVEGGALAVGGVGSVLRLI